MTAIAAAASAGGAAAVAALLVADRRGCRRARAAAKVAASAAFLVVAAALCAEPPAGPEAASRARYTAWLVGGLAWGAVGDALLLGAGRAWLRAGLGAFLIGHAAYVAAIAQVVPIAAWPASAGLWAVAPLAAAIAALRWLWPHLGALRGPVIVYVAAIAAMVVGALAALRAGDAALEPSARHLLVLGALLFFASDLAVARDRFLAPAFRNRLWGLPAYYAGQHLLAWTLAPAG